MMETMWRESLPNQILPCCSITTFTHSLTQFYFKPSTLATESVAVHLDSSWATSNANITESPVLWMSLSYILYRYSFAITKHQLLNTHTHIQWWWLCVFRNIFLKRWYGIIRMAVCNSVPYLPLIHITIFDLVSPVLLSTLTEWSGSNSKLLLQKNWEPIRIEQWKLTCITWCFIKISASFWLS